MALFISGIANDIIKHFVNGKGKGQLYDRLAFFVDKFGARFTGTKNLEDAIGMSKWNYCEILSYFSMMCVQTL